MQTVMLRRPSREDQFDLWNGHASNLNAKSNAPPPITALLPDWAEHDDELAGEYRRALAQTDRKALRPLVRAGVTERALNLAKPALIRLQLHDQRFFEPDPESDYSAFIVPVRVDLAETPECTDPEQIVAAGAIVDLVAFSPGLRQRWALRRGAAEWLGACTPQYLEPPPVRLYRSPLDWLRGDCDGLVCLTSEPLDVYRFLTRFYAVSVDDDEHAAELREVLDRPAFHPEIIIGGGH